MDLNPPDKVIAYSPPPSTVVTPIPKIITSCRGLFLLGLINKQSDCTELTSIAANYFALFSLFPFPHPLIKCNFTLRTICIIETQKKNMFDKGIIYFW
jgi:hypothetical protein